MKNKVFKKIPIIHFYQLWHEKSNGKINPFLIIQYYQATYCHLHILITFKFRRINPKPCNWKVLLMAFHRALSYN